MNTANGPTLVYSGLGLLTLALAGMAFDERPVVVCALIALFLAFVAEVQADRAGRYDEDSVDAGRNVVRLRTLGIAVYLVREFEASQVLYVAAVGFAVLGWVLIWA